MCLSLIFSDIVLCWLDGMNLAGWVPYGVQFLPHLEKLSLVNSKLEGELPGFALAKPTALHTIDVHNNTIKGKVPVGLTSSRSLLYLDLSNNNFSDVLPDELGRMNLETLDLASNNLTGPIPDSIYVSKLEILDLQSNQFTGPISSEIGQLSTLKELNLAQNLFQGEVPSELSALTSLQKMWIHDTDLKGSIPSDMCRTGLTVLEADCRTAVNGLTEVECTCCTVCCDLNGERCENQNVEFGAVTLP